MTRRRRAVVIAFVCWTLLVWGQRVANLVTGDEGTTAVAVSATLAAVLIGLAVATVVVLVAGRARGGAVPTDGARRVVQAFALVTVAVWVVRGAGIVVDWRSIGFVVVHLVLAGVSIALATLTWRAVTPTATGVPEGLPPGSS